jgi:hypothetical protein
MSSVILTYAVRTLGFLLLALPTSEVNANDVIQARRSFREDCRLESLKLGTTSMHPIKIVETGMHPLVSLCTIIMNV